jgi:hypothetical protein
MPRNCKNQQQQQQQHAGTEQWKQQDMPFCRLRPPLPHLEGHLLSCTDKPAKCARLHLRALLLCRIWLVQQPGDDSSDQDTARAVHGTSRGELGISDKKGTEQDHTRNGSGQELQAAGTAAAHQQQRQQQV